MRFGFIRSPESPLFSSARALKEETDEKSITIPGPVMHLLLLIVDAFGATSVYASMGRSNLLLLGPSRLYALRSDLQINLESGALAPLLGTAPYWAPRPIGLLQVLAALPDGWP